MLKKKRKESISHASYSILSVTVTDSEITRKKVDLFVWLYLHNNHVFCSLLMFYSHPHVWIQTQHCKKQSYSSNDSPLKKKREEITGGIQFQLLTPMKVANSFNLQKKKKKDLSIKPRSLSSHGFEISRSMPKKIPT